MHNQIDRKFLIEKMPSLFWRRSSIYERYFLQHGDLVEERIQKCGNVYEYEIRTAISPRERTREKRTITKEEFNHLKKNHKPVIRETYIISKKNPRITINKYRGDYKGLVYAEAEFDSVDEAEAFSPPSWMGPEITNCPLGRDSWLLGLDREHFLRALDTEMDNLHAHAQSFT